MPIRAENKQRYPKDWKLRSRFIRFYRAKNKCEWCGAENYKPHPITGSKVILTTAHVYDHRPEAASLLNLAALCNRCHLNHDREKHQRNRQINRLRNAETAGQMSLFSLPGECAGWGLQNPKEEKKIGAGLLRLRSMSRAGGFY
ncbi:hypothetical protein Nhal_1137 [Nitrosococcus halophilus Nc 4]|uniref:HNH endonuclease n=1 Tax=Nitrosococcus halophilus (strain Nc4) TaxID=472759 RepID=D5BZL0_NITHN|nr:hypothetical protein [Nitrosococcus halophilus]ADE14305.1 hypothetical protein Nhal_1137 [Nitrosococcus halophilus Nc 4]